MLLKVTMMKILKTVLLATYVGEEVVKTGCWGIQVHVAQKGGRSTGKVCSAKFPILKFELWICRLSLLLNLDLLQLILNNDQCVFLQRFAVLDKNY